MATAGEDETLKAVTATTEASTLRAKETFAKVTDALKAIPNERINATAGTKRIYADASRDLYHQSEKLKKLQVKYGDDVKEAEMEQPVAGPRCAYLKGENVLADFAENNDSESSNAENDGSENSDSGSEGNN